MKDNTFFQALEEMNQRALNDITDEALRCWIAVRQGATIASATASIEHEHMRDAVLHMLFYLQVQSLLFDARHRQLINDTQYKELRGYIDTLANQVKQQPFTTLPLNTT